jgi:DNA-directed RNA polymerase specialized sigma24 family protein
LGVSRNTVRCYLRRDPDPRRPKKKRFFRADEELDLARRIARRYRTSDREELESHLITVIAEAYPKKALVDDWKAFLATSLHNGALNWLRSQRRYEQRVTIAGRRPTSENEDDVNAIDRVASVDLSIDDRLAFDRALEDASPLMRRVWDVMPLTNFDQTEAARRMRVSRNTVGKAWRQLRLLLNQHGF